MTTDTDTPQIEQPTPPQFGYFRFEHSFPEYGGTKSSVSVPYEINADPEVTALNLRLAAIDAKVAVFREQNVETESLPDGTIIEILKVKLGGTVVDNGGSTATQQQRPSQPASNGGGSDVKAKVWKRIDVIGQKDDRGGQKKLGNPSWLYDQIRDAQSKGKVFGTNSEGFIELWDNRSGLPQYGGTGKPNTPWFKDKNGTGEAVWAPKDHACTSADWRDPEFVYVDNGAPPQDEEPF